MIMSLIIVVVARVVRGVPRTEHLNCLRLVLLRGLMVSKVGEVAMVTLVAI